MSDINNISLRKSFLSDFHATFAPSVVNPIGRKITTDNAKKFHNDFVFCPLEGTYRGCYSSSHTESAFHIKKRTVYTHYNPPTRENVAPIICRPDSWDDL